MPSQLPRGRTFLLFPGSALLLALGGCDAGEQFDPTSPVIPTSVASASIQRDTVGVPFTTVYDLDLSISGHYEPGMPVAIRAVATARRPAAHTAVSLHLPEFTVAQRRGWDYRELPVGEFVPEVASSSGATIRGQQRAATATVSFGAPGLYRVSAKVVGEGPQVTDSGELLIWSSHREMWMLVDSTGGALSDSFHLGLIPDDVLPIPGPFRSASSGVPQSLASSSAGAMYRAVYWNDELNQYDPVGGAFWQAYPYEGYTDNQGNFSVPCDGSSGTVWFTDHTIVSVGGPGASFNPGMCSGHQITMSGPHAQVYTNVRTSAQTAVSEFNAVRPNLVVAYVQSVDNSYYDRLNDIIRIKSDGHVWYNWGRFVTAHEYGHAYHHKALGGIRGGGCPSPHYLDEESNLGCAYSEGFADYFGIKTLASAYASTLEVNGWYTTGDNGAEVEGAVAAFLWDLTDSSLEAHDSIDWAGSYLRDLYKTCKADGSPADGIDQFIYCAENGIDHGVDEEKFGRNAPSGYSESASEPSSWSRDHVRIGWLMNLYDEVWDGTYGTSGGLNYDCEPDPFSVLECAEG